MNENHIPGAEQGASADRIEKQRREDDDALASAMLRYALVRTWVAQSRQWNLLLLGSVIAGAVFQRLDMFVPWAAATLLAPFAIAVFMSLRGTAMRFRVKKAFERLPLWERHRINLVLKRIDEKGEAL